MTKDNIMVSQKEEGVQARVFEQRTKRGRSHKNQDGMKGTAKWINLSVCSLNVQLMYTYLNSNFLSINQRSKCMYLNTVLLHRD